MPKIRRSPPAGSRERAQADLASLCRRVRELRRRAALTALCGAARFVAPDAEERLAGIDPELPGLLTTADI